MNNVSLAAGKSIWETFEIPQPAALPYVFRIVNIENTANSSKGVTYAANIFHEKASLSVCWDSHNVDSKLIPGTLVSMRWLGTKPICVNGRIKISRLVALEHPVAALNLFDTVPYEWVKDRTLIKRVASVLENAPVELNFLLNAIFWDSKRFYRFLVGPSSIKGHHKERNGNFRHSVEVAEIALKLAENKKLVCASVLMMAALLHDAGKADEYTFNYQRGVFEISPRGVLVGHKLTVLEWIAAAKIKCNVNISESHYLALIHALTASKGAPAWIGIREPKSLESLILSMADRLSGQHELFSKLATETDGFGQYHSHLNGRPFLISEVM